MKVYLYDLETGCYQGEDFAELPHLGGVHTAVPGCTTLAPPSYAPGVVPVFKYALQCWELESVGNLTIRKGGGKP